MKKIERQEIISKIKYELVKGEHTYTMCKCGRSGCRNDKCVYCLLEELE